MREIKEGKLLFSFPDHWSVTKYDIDGDFYKKNINALSKRKAVDILALNNDKALFLIEIKDFSYNEDSLDVYKLIEGISGKIFDTCGGLFVAKRSENKELKTFANYLISENVKNRNIVIIIHIDINIKEPKKKKILLSKINIIYTKIQQKLSFMKFSSIILERSDMPSNLGWQVKKI